MSEQRGELSELALLLAPFALVYLAALIIFCPPFLADLKFFTLENNAALIIFCRAVCGGLVIFYFGNNAALIIFLLWTKIFNVD